jgi:uncharacterized protein YoxC
VIGPTLPLADSVGPTLTILGTLIGLTAVAAALTVVFVLQRRDQVQKKQREWIEDLTGRLDYVEPKMKTLLSENKALRTLLNPTAQLERNHSEVMVILKRQSDMLEDIQHKVERSDT